eukprot:768440-Hanusia_phi.AAC.9
MLDVKQWQAALCPRNSKRMYLSWQPAAGELGRSREDRGGQVVDGSRKEGRSCGLLELPLARGLFELTMRTEEEREEWFLLLLSRSECARAAYMV